MVFHLIWYLTVRGSNHRRNHTWNIPLPGWYHPCIPQVNLIYKDEEELCKDEEIDEDGCDEEDKDIEVTRRVPVQRAVERDEIPYPSAATRETPRRDAASPITYNGLHVPQPGS